jgi:DNA-binding CsgD family transcriptional regulator/PAS domain-containing protein
MQHFAERPETSERPPRPDDDGSSFPLLRRAARAQGLVRLRCDPATGRCRVIDDEGLEPAIVEAIRGLGADAALNARFATLVDGKPSPLSPEATVSPLLEQLARFGYPHQIGLTTSLDGTTSNLVLVAERPFDDADTAALEMTLRQLRSLRRLRLHCREQRHRLALQQTILDHLEVGVAAVSRNGNVLLASERTRRLLRRNRFLRLMGVRLTADSPIDAATLRRAVASAVDHGRSSRLLLGEDDDEVVTVAVRPITLTGSKGSARVAALFLNPDANTLAAGIQRLAADHGLTPTERRLVAQLALGASVERTAAVLGVRPQTARTHLKHVFAKLGVQRQSELVAWLHARRQPVAADEVGASTGRVTSS